jgi:hypothetical protein
VGPLAAWWIHALDWAGIWQAIVVYLFPAGAIRRDQAAAPPALKAGTEVVGARGDIPRDCGSALDPLYGQVTGPLAIDGEP